MNIYEYLLILFVSCATKTFLLTILFHVSVFFLHFSYYIPREAPLKEAKMDDNKESKKSQLIHTMTPAEEEKKCFENSETDGVPLGLTRKAICMQVRCYIYIE